MLSLMLLLALLACRAEKPPESGTTESVPPSLDACPVSFRYTAQTGPDAVYVAGTFNDWDRTDLPLERDGSDWVVETTLPPGTYAYKFVEVSFDGAGSTSWACDPAATYAQCDEGYAWDRSCTAGGGGCNSVIVVPDCNLPTLSVSALNIDRSANAVTASISVSGALSEPWATLDDTSLDDAWTGAGFEVAATGLSEGRHVIRVGGKAADGTEIEPVYIPFWLDERDWSTGLLYFVFVDRFVNGDTSIDGAEGATVDYAGGDFQGVIDKLDYLDNLGVTVLWLTNPQDNPAGAWDGKCNATYSGYHGYWPSSDGVEEHFGDEAKLQELIAAAHARNMRVVVDWVANHVHTDHPFYTEHPEWFNDPYICDQDEDGNGQSNWDQRPETCWFTSYLPDIRYYELDPLTVFVDDAMRMARDWELDGFRVDAVKHMPQSVFFNLQTRIRTEIEHSDAGGDEDFYTVGETFTGDRGLISKYVGDEQLDAQFDFPLYWAILAAFAREEIGLSNGDGSLQSVMEASEAAYGGATMSLFLGNHDVSRFIAHASGEVSSLYGDGACGSDGNLKTADTAPGSIEPYQKLMLAWTFLLTQPGLPLVYYGDEIGLPGYDDPDNRQNMRFDSDLSTYEAMVLSHVQKLGQARRDNPAMASADRVDWWESDADLYAYARGGEVLVLINRSSADRTVSNGLSFAGLSDGTYTDALSGQRFTASGDSLSVTVPARGSLVLIKDP